MTADTEEELHRFARKLGLRREWFQDKPHHQHYDLVSAKHAKAVELGAVHLSMREYAANYRRLPIAADWERLGLEYEADLALGMPEEELIARAGARYDDYLADRALRLPPKRRRARKATSGSMGPSATER